VNRKQEETSQEATPPDLRFDRRVATGGVDVAAAGVGRLRVLTGLTRATGGGRDEEGDDGEAAGERKAIGSGDSGESGSENFASTVFTIGSGAAGGAGGGGGGGGVLAATGRGAGGTGFLGEGTGGVGFVSLAGTAGIGRAMGVDLGAGVDSGLTIGGRACTAAAAAAAGRGRA